MGLRVGLGIWLCYSAFRAYFGSGYQTSSGFACTGGRGRKVQLQYARNPELPCFLGLGFNRLSPKPFSPKLSHSSSAREVERFMNKRASSKAGMVLYPNPSLEEVPVGPKTYTAASVYTYTRVTRPLTPCTLVPQPEYSQSLNPKYYESSKTLNPKP